MSYPPVSLRSIQRDSDRQLRDQFMDQLVKLPANEDLANYGPGEFLLALREQLGHNSETPRAGYIADPRQFYSCLLGYLLTDLRLTDPQIVLHFAQLIQSLPVQD